MVSGGFTRDLQALPGHPAALPGHLAALPGHLAALLGHLAALPGHLAALSGPPILSTRRLPGRLQALAASDNISRTDPGFSKPRPDWPDCRPVVRTMVRTGRLGTLFGIVEMVAALIDVRGPDTKGEGSFGCTPL